jgi:hypothetical protein
MHDMGQQTVYTCSGRAMIVTTDYDAPTDLWYAAIEDSVTGVVVMETEGFATEFLAHCAGCDVAGDYEG